jgi:hypothetical protein
MANAFAEFCRAHGGSPIRAGSGSTLLPDGAEVRNGGTMPVFAPPSDDPKHRAMAIRKYQRLRAEMAESDLAKLEAAIRPWVPGCPVAPPFAWDSKTWGPDPGDPKMARSILRAIAAAARKKIAELDAQIGPPIFA